MSQAQDHPRTLQQSLVAMARRRSGHFAFADSSGAQVTFGQALTKAIFLSGRLAPIWRGQEKVGILVPPSVGGVLVNWAALLMGKVPVNLNYTLSEAGIISCIDQCGLTDIVVSAKLMKRLKLELPDRVRVHLVEDLAAGPRFSEKLRALALAKLFPEGALLDRLGGGDAVAGDLATVIFSSGSTGEPKGVMLSHANIAATLVGLDQAFHFTDDDRILGVLPLFHSFGFVATVGGPAVLGFGIAYHFNPVEAKVIGPLIQQHRVTFMVATPTFLQFYLRSCEPEQLASLRCVLASAEKLPDRVADAFEKKFGVRPLEFYGCTECLAVTANAPGTERKGSIGRPLSGVELKVLDPETGADGPPDAEGVLAVRAASIMQGYLGLPEKTAEVFREGWYSTGDMVRIDEDGFVWITGRLSRFSKIGGEMVPHGRVEEALHEIAELTEQTFAVAGVPDDRKGERLVVLHTADDATVDATIDKLATAEIPNLWKPKRSQFVAIDALPLLGTGKLDLKGLQKLAGELG